MKRFMAIVLIIVAVVVIVATLLPLIRKEAWWIRGFDFPRLQLVTLGLLALAGGMFFWNWKSGWYLGTGALLALAVLFQLAQIFPYTMLAPRQSRNARDVKEDSTLSLMVANVLMTNRNAASFLDLVRKNDPDILLALEPDAWWEEQLRPIEETHPHTVKKPLDNLYGLLLYSRLELIDPEIRFLIKEGIPSLHTRVRLPSGQVIWFHGLHPEPPAPDEASSTTPRDAELLVVGRAIKDRDLPTVVAGDLNDVAWSYTTTLFQRISGMLDPRRGRGMYNTFHAKHFFLRWPLDHVFHSDHFTLIEMRRLGAFGSDHFPVSVKLHLEKGAKALQDEPDVDEEDLEEAKEKIREARESEGSP